MGDQLRRRWGGLPRWSRWVLAAYLAGFAEGGCLHLFWLLANGTHTYALFPVPIQVYFTSLVLLDPMVVVLAALARPSGVLLGAPVMALDVTGNWIGNWPGLKADPTQYLQVFGLPSITLFGLFVIVTAVPLLRAMDVGREEQKRPVLRSEQ